MTRQQSGDKMIGRPLTRRRFVRGLALGATGLTFGWVAGCGSSGSTETAPARGTSAAASPTSMQPVSGGKLAIAVITDITPSNIPFAASPTNGYIQEALYDRIAYYPHTSLDPQPELAESWKWAPDFSSLTLKLRQGVKWHTGRTFTAEDVKWNVETAKTAKDTKLLGYARWVTKIETPDQTTCTIYFDAPRPSFFDLFENMYVVDPQTFEDSQNGKNFVGTGAFKLREWVPGDHFTAVRNPDYWKKGLPYLDEVTTRVIPDNQSRLINLQTGAIDMAGTVDPRDAKDLEKDKNYYRVPKKTLTAFYYLGCDVTVPPFDNKKVRQAMSLLLDRDRIQNSFLFYGATSCIPWGANSPAYDAELAKKGAYDPAKAKDLLTQAGIKAPDRSIPMYCATGLPDNWAMAEMLQAELAKLGWKSSVEKIQSAEFTARLSSANFKSLWLNQVAYMHMNPSSLFVQSFPYRVPNSSAYDSPEYRKLIDDMLTVGDQARLKTIYRQMNELLLDESFMIPIAESYQPIIASAKVKDCECNRSSYPTTKVVWKAK